MTRSLAFLLLPLCVALLGFSTGERRCHSEEYLLAKQKLQKMVLTKAQQDAIVTYEQEFNRKWRETHRRHGCSHHEAHAAEFVAAASGVLTDTQFVTFRGRKRNQVETLGYDIWTNGQYISNLLKLAKAI